MRTRNKGCDQGNCSGCHPDTHIACFVLSFLYPMCRHTSEKQHESDNNIADRLRCLADQDGYFLQSMEQHELANTKHSPLA